MDSRKYDKVIQACCLIPDIEQFGGQHVDLATRSVSGGQQQRIAIARAIYQQCNLLLLDNPISALDPPVAAQILHNLCRDFPAQAIVATFLDHKWTKEFASVYLLSGKKLIRARFSMMSKIVHQEKEKVPIKKGDEQQSALADKKQVKPKNLVLLKHILSFWRTPNFLFNLFSSFQSSLSSVISSVVPTIWFANYSLCVYL